MEKKYLIFLLICLILLGFSNVQNADEIADIYTSGQEDMPERPYFELRIDTDRAGFERYYRLGEGYPITDYFGVASSIEIYDEQKNIEDMSLIAGLEAPNYGGIVPDEMLRQFLRPVFTRNYVGYATLTYKKFPRFRYTFTNKNFILQFINKDIYEWNQHNFDIIYPIPGFGRPNFITLNPVYEKRYLEKKNRERTHEISDVFLFQYSVVPSDNFELFGQFEWVRSQEEHVEENKSTSFDFRLEPRILIPQWMLRITTGYYRGETHYKPGGDEVTKQEYYLDFGKDFAEHWRNGLRLEYVKAENMRGNILDNDIYTDSFWIRDKLTYAILPWWDLSAGFQYEDDMELDKFDSYGLFVETEIIREGFFRSTASVQWNRYDDLDKDECLLALRFHLFRDMQTQPKKNRSSIKPSWMLNTDPDEEYVSRPPWAGNPEENSKQENIQSSGNSPEPVNNQGVQSKNTNENMDFENDISILQEDKSFKMPPFVISFGGRAGDNDVDGYVDLLAPVIGNETGVVMLNPKGSFSEHSENEQNLGLVLRKMLLDNKAIIGGNVFYDSRESTYGNHYDQLGLGIEMLTEWIDGRFNYYLPNDNGDPSVIATQESQGVEVSFTETQRSIFFHENSVKQGRVRTTTTTTTTHYYDKFERALEGYDFELGVKLPYIDKWADTRVFGGYYSYDAKYGNDLEGFKARLEIKAMPGLIFDAEWFEDKELHGSDYYVGARVRVPFEIGDIFQGKNPFVSAKDFFTRGKETMESRMTDMVVRDLDIILEESDFIEDPSKMTMEDLVEVNYLAVTLLDDITFVDGDRTEPDKNYAKGTYENPYTRIQSGVDNAFGDKYVYVDLAPEYYENIRLKDGVVLWGCGYEVYGIEAGVPPVVDGRSNGPALTMADNTQVWGMRIVNTDQGGPSINKTFLGTTYDLRRVGIYSNNKTNIKIINNNVFEANSTSVLLTSIKQNKFETVISNNTFQYNDSGIILSGKGGSGSFNTSIENNAVSNNGIGVQIITKKYASFNADISHNIINGNSVGIKVLSSTDGNLSTRILENDVSQNTGTNVELDLSTNNGDINFQIEGNDVSRSSNLLGILVDAEVKSGKGKIDAAINSNNADDNNFENMKIDLVSRNDNINIAVLDNLASNSKQDKGISVTAVVNGSERGKVSASIENNTADNNATTNIVTWLNSKNDDIDLSVLNNRASDAGAGFGLLAIAEVLDSGSGKPGSLNATISGNTINNNKLENIKMDFDTFSGDMDIMVLNNIANSSNSSLGILLLADTFSGDIDADVTGNKANSNNGHNIEINLNSAGSLEATISANITSQSAGGMGLLFNANAVGASAVNITDNTATENFNENIKVDVDSVNGPIAINVRRNTVLDGLGVGLAVEAKVTGSGKLDIFGDWNIMRNNDLGLKTKVSSGTGTVSIDFGGGVLGSTGNNSLTGSFWQDMFDFSSVPAPGFTIYAQNNYWTGGSSFSRYGTAYPSIVTITTIPELSSDPNP
ncbi:MAG: hypothetical protein P9M03_06015 [Candidatus Theseobacter exili]|nr:hypothetical protein [Candidatus Theseobacter exili]